MAVTSHFFSKIFFSDETYVDVGEAKSQYVRRSKGESLKSDHGKIHRAFCKRVLFWGCFRGDGTRRLVHVKGTMTTTKYIETLNAHLLPLLPKRGGSDEPLFQHDNAPSHTSRCAKDFLSKKKIRSFSWPPYSPDLAPIENLWAILKRKVHERRHQSVDELIEHVLQVWDSDEFNDICAKLAESMPDRIDACIANKGGIIKY